MGSISLYRKKSRSIIRDVITCVPTGVPDFRTSIPHLCIEYRPPGHAHGGGRSCMHDRSSTSMMGSSTALRIATIVVAVLVVSASGEATLRRSGVYSRVHAFLKDRARLREAARATPSLDQPVARLSRREQEEGDVARDGERSIVVTPTQATPVIANSVPPMRILIDNSGHP